MNVLFTGRGGAGSWRIRGEQLAAAMPRAAAVPQAAATVLATADVVVVVKRLSPALLAAVRACGRPWVWDVVDAYPQPACSAWTRAEAIAWMRQQVAQANPTAVVWPTRRMQQDCGDSRPGVVLYHHHRPGLAPVAGALPRRVVYEGAAHYLGRWLPRLTAAASAVGLPAVLNPAQLASGDIVVALRDTPHAGYVQRHWKSNVKLANAQAVGAPFIAQRECGYVETSTGGEYWVDAPEQLTGMLHRAATADGVQRATTYRRALHGAYSVHQAAADLQEFLRGL